MSLCPICFENPPSSPFRTLPSCSHAFCTSCLNNLLKHQCFKCPIDEINFPETHRNIDCFPLLSGRLREQTVNNDKEQHEGLIHKARVKFDDLQDRLKQKMKRSEFEVEVFFYEEKARSREIFHKNTVFNQDVHTLLGQLENSDEITPEFIEAYEKEGQLDYEFEKNADLVRQQQGFFQARKSLTESFKQFEGSSMEVLKRILGPKLVSPELMRQVGDLFRSEGEARFMMIKTMGLFKMKVDDEDWLVISPSKGNDDDIITYEKIKNVEKVDIRLDGAEHTEMMILGMSFLLESLEKVAKLCTSFCRRFVSNWEARSLAGSSVWKKIKSLTVDFTECTLEDEETPLVLLRKVPVESFEGFKLFLKNTNATEKTVVGFGKEIVSRMSNVQRFGLDFHFMSDIGVQAVKTVLVENIEVLKNLHMLELDARKTGMTDEGVILLSEKVIPELKNLKELRLWVGHSQLTDKGLTSLFKSIKENLTGTLKNFLLGLSENNVTDESLSLFACDVLPLLENLEEFKVWVDKTSVTDKSLVPLCQNIKGFAPKLKIFALGVEATGATDEMMNALASEAMGLMSNKLEIFYVWFSGTKITDQSLIKLYAAAGNSRSLANVQKFELDCSDTGVTDESFRVFGDQVLPTMTKLKEFTFYSNKTKLQDFKSFFGNLVNAKAQLRSVTLSVDETELRDESIMVLAETLPVMKNLSVVSLWFNKTKLGDSSIGPLCKSLKGIAKNLECLDLCLNETLITDKSISVLGDEIANEMKSLKELRLWVSSTQVGDKGLKAVFRNLKGTMRNMKVIQLCLYQTLITDELLRIFAEESLENTESLQLFEFWAAETKISDMGMVPVLASLKKSTVNITKLVLSLQGTNITDITFLAMERTIVANLLNLKDFLLLFGQTKVSNISMLLFFASMADKVQGLRSFELGLNDVVSDPCINLFASIVLPNLIRTQEFKLYWTSALSDMTYKNLCLNAKKAIKNIKTFNLSASSFSIATDLTSSNERSLKELGFELKKCDLSDNTMHEILRSFEDQVSQVKTFAFLMNETGVSYQCLKILGDHYFFNMRELTSLRIELNGTEFSDDIFTQMCKNLEYFAKNLKTFKIDVGITNITNASVRALAEYGFANMESLENLELYFYYNENIEQAFEYLFSNMKNCAKKLQSLILSLPGIKLTPESVQALGTEMFANCENLNSFNLALCQTQIRAEDFEVLFKGLKGVLKDIKALTLFIYEDLTDEGLDAFSREMLPGLVNLESLRLWLSHVKIGDESFIRMSRVLQGMEEESKVNDFLLKCEGTEVGNEGVGEFGLKTLGAMKKLKTLDLSFGESNNVGDEGVAKLFEGLSGIVGNLQALNLDLHRIGGMTDVGVVSFKEKLAERIGESDGLEKLTLDFSENNISRDSQDFVNSIIL